MFDQKLQLIWRSQFSRCQPVVNMSSAFELPNFLLEGIAFSTSRKLSGPLPFLERQGMAAVFKRSNIVLFFTRHNDLPTVGRCNPNQ
jgi:hypothetical protein